jgi:branched-chain amino acid transport system substrate-binding protein
VRLAVVKDSSGRPPTQDAIRPLSSIVKIGHVAPLTGPIGHLGKDNEFGARMAIDELNEKGVMIGGRRITFELLSKDDGADPKKGVTAAQELVEARVSGVVGHLNSGTSIPASKIYSDAGVPQISPSATNPKYTRQGSAHVKLLVASVMQPTAGFPAWWPPRCAQD